MVTDDQGANDPAQVEIEVDTSGWVFIQVVEGDSIGSSISLSLINGRPAVCFEVSRMNPDNLYLAELHYALSSSSTGLGEGDWSQPVMVASGDFAGWGSSMVEVEGHPAIVFQCDSTVKYSRSSTPDGLGEGDWDNQITLRHGYSGLSQSMQVVDGNPAVCWGDGCEVWYVRSTSSTGESSPDWTHPLMLDDSG